MTRFTSAAILLLCIALSLLFTGCGNNQGQSMHSDADANLTTRGSIEVTATLVEVPEGAIFKRDLYDYTTILKYKILKVHRGEVKADTIYVGHYDPWKPRNEAADRRIKDIGGNLRSFQAGQAHRMALQVPLDDYFMGGIVNKYFGQETGPLYWAVWCNVARE